MFKFGSGWRVFLGAFILYVSLNTNAIMPDFYGEAVGYDIRQPTSNAPNEIIDPFSGTLNLVHDDLVIPGNGAMDIRVQRVYSSQNVYARTLGVGSVTSSALGSLLQRRTPYGIGWSMHFGRIRVADGLFGRSCPVPLISSSEDNPVLETQDGQQKILFCNDYPRRYGTSADFVTKDHWVANELDDNSGYEVIDSNGTKYTMNYRLFGSQHPHPEATKQRVYYTTRIEDKNGNTIDISYRTQSSGENVLLHQIKSSDRRTVTFDYVDLNDPRRVRLRSISHFNRTVRYTFDSLSNFVGLNGLNYYFLRSVDLPGFTTSTGRWDYSYYNRALRVVGDNMLESVTYPTGGKTTYDYEYHCFISSACFPHGRNNSIVIKTKINGGRDITQGRWTYRYVGRNSHDTTTITGPNSIEVYKHFGLWGTGSDLNQNPVEFGDRNAGLWRIGLLFEKEIFDLNNNLIQKEEYDYEGRVISDEFYTREPYSTTRVISDPDVFSSYVTEYRITRENKTYTTKFENFADNINPHRIVQIGQATRTRTLTYYPRKDGQNIVSQVQNERYIGNDSPRITRSFDSNGNLRSESLFGVTTSYGYDSQGNVRSIRDARDNVTQYSRYSRGIPRTETKPEGVTITRTVNTYGNVTSQTDGRGHTKRYSYDGLNRLTDITYPSGKDSKIVWGTSRRTLTRGGYRQIIYYDGFGRKTCTQSENIYIGQAYDGVGNRVYETYPNFSSCRASTRTRYTYDALNRLRRTIHPDDTYSEITYRNNNVERLRDERGSIFDNAYRSFDDPDQKELVRLTGPENLDLTINRNILDQVTSLTRNGVNRSYTYNSNRFLISENNPETGRTTYGRDAVGNMTSRKVATSATTSFTYDDLNRLEHINYPRDTPDVNYRYDKNDNVTMVDSGIAKIEYNYDANNNLTQERHNIDGTNYFLSYAYTDLDHLDMITYADGDTVDYTSNDLGWPTKAAPYINSISYDAFGRPTEFRYANGRQTTQSYTTRGWPQRTVVNGNISNRERRYDAVGNLIRLNDRIDNRFNRSMTYDRLNRLKSASGAWGLGRINYSTNDDIITKRMGGRSLNYNYNNFNQMNTVSNLANFSGTARYRYDVYGNVIEKIHGNTGWRYTYDEASNLRQVRDANNKELRQYDYSGDKQRVRSIKENEVRVHIVSKDGQILNEFVTSGEKPNITNVFVGNRLIAELETDNGSDTPATVFGFGYGNNANRNFYSTAFTLEKPIIGDVKICINGYDISDDTEVSVRVNGVLIGYVNSGPDQIETCFDLTSRQVSPGSNSITFTQSSPGQLWGVSLPNITQINIGVLVPIILWTLSLL